MEMFLVSFGIMVVVGLAMAVGYIFQGKELKGSCGGLGKIMGEDCMFCEKKEQCKRKEEQSETGSLVNI